MSMRLINLIIFILLTGCSIENKEQAVQPELPEVPPRIVFISVGNDQWRYILKDTVTNTEYLVVNNYTDGVAVVKLEPIKPELP